MTVRALDENGDIVTSGKHFIDGQEEIAQTAKTRLKLFSGEYFRNINEGTPWFQSILTKRTSLANKDAQIRRRITQTPNVTRLTGYEADFDFDTRSYTINASILTPYGEEELQIDEAI